MQQIGERFSSGISLESIMAEKGKAARDVYVKAFGFPLSWCHRAWVVLILNTSLRTENQKTNAPLRLQLRLADETRMEKQRAAVLVVRQGVQEVLRDVDDANEQLYREIWNQPFDNSYLDIKKKRVYWKWGRLNNCFADQDQTPDIENGKGTVINFTHVPLLQQLRQGLPELISSDKVPNNLYVCLRQVRF